MFDNRWQKKIMTRALATEAVDTIMSAQWRAMYWNSRSRLFFNSKEISLSHQINSQKFATMLYKTKNLGDEIQSIAHQRFLPNAALAATVIRDQPKRAAISRRKSILIANGWFSHKPMGLIFNNDIFPIFLSVHIDNENQLCAHSCAYLRRHEPIGCRDLATVQMLESRNIKAYLSRCLTLTIPNPFPAPFERSEILIVDAHQEQKCSYPPGADEMLKKLIPRDIQCEASFLECETKLSHRNYLGKFWQAEALLKRYARAKLIITTRLHCALPSIAMGTPVIFLHRNYHSDARFDGLRDILDGYSCDDEFLRVDPYSPPRKDISSIQKELRNKALSLIERSGAFLNG